MKRLILIPMFALLITACDVSDPSSTTTSPATCLTCGGDGDGTMPAVQLLTAPLDWAGDPASPPSDLALTPPTTIDPTDEDIAALVGAASWDWGDGQSFARHLRCANQGWIGCQIEREFSDSYFTWVCWVKTPVGNAYCMGGAESSRSRCTPTPTEIRTSAA
jgi:hypothetical protein